MPLLLGFLLVTLMALSGWGLELQAQRPDDLSGLTDQELYKFSCANCHGLDGRGLDRSLIGFEEEIPDFTEYATALTCQCRPVRACHLLCTPALPRASRLIRRYFFRGIVMRLIIM